MFYYILSNIVILYNCACNLLDRMLNLIKNNPKGVTDKEIQNGIPEVNIQKRVAILNKLISQVKFLISVNLVAIQMILSISFQ